MLFVILMLTATVLFYCTRAGGGMRWPAHLWTLVPALLMTLVLVQADSMREPDAAGEGSSGWRVTLAGLQFHLSAAESIRIGGDARTDHLYVRGMPAGLLAMERNAAGELIFKRSGAAGGVAIIRVVDESSSASASATDESMWGGIAVPAGSKFCRADRNGGCSGPSLSWSQGEDMAQLVDGANQPLCTVPNSTPARPGELRIYALADYARPACAGDQPFAWSSAQPAGEFLYWHGEAGREQLYLFPADGVKYAIGRAPGGFEVRAAVVHHLRPGEQRDVYFHRYVRQDPIGSSGASSARVGRIRDIRSFRIRHTPAADGRNSLIEVFLHTQEATRVSLGPEATLTITSKVSNPATLSEGAAVAGFEVMGAPAAAELINLLKLESGSRDLGSWSGQARGCFAGASTLTIRGMSRLDCAPVGRWFSIGDPQYLQAKVRVAPLQVPATWLAAVWVLALANLLVRAALGTPLSVRVVLLCLEVLLALRLLVAFDASLVDARQEGTVAAGWFAVLCLPAAFELTARAATASLQAAAARVGKMLLIAAGVALVATALGLGEGFTAVRAALVQDVGTVILVFAALCVALVLMTRVAIPAAGMLSERRAAWNSSNTAAALLIALALVHVLLALVGVREQIGGLRVSTLLVPLLVLAWGNWFVRMAQPAATLREVARAMGVAFLPLAGFLIARDNGAYVYFIALALLLLPLAWPWITLHLLPSLLIGMVLTALLLVGFALLDPAFATLFTVALTLGAAGVITLYLLYRSKRVSLDARALWALPTAVALAGVLGLHVSSLVLSTGNAVASAAPAQVQDLDRIVAIQGNSIRLLDLIAPRTVEQLGLRQGYEQRAAMSEMFAYAGTFTGRGWPSSAAPRELRLTHVDDAVAAVHLVAPFGRIAALGLAALLAAFAAGIAMLLRDRSDVSAQQARFAVATLVVVSLYMLFANIGVVPFTGRNFYFLSVASNSDLLEGGLLLTIVAAALAVRRQEEQR